MKTVVYRSSRTLIFALTTLSIVWFGQFFSLLESYSEQKYIWIVGMIIAYSGLTVCSIRFDLAFDCLRKNYGIQPVKWLLIKPGEIYLYALAPALFLEHRINRIHFLTDPRSTIYIPIAYIVVFVGIEVYRHRRAAKR